MDTAICHCGSEEFFEGPSGGMCMNIKCAECGCVYNLTPFHRIDFIEAGENCEEGKRQKVG